MTKEGSRIEILLNATARRNPTGEIIGEWSTDLSYSDLCCPARTNSGSRPGVVGIGQDITGRIAQEREYTRLIDTANAPIFGVDTQCGA
jgi:hypothetical protein